MRRVAHFAPRRQRGVAALTAILVVALASALAAELAWEQYLYLKRTEVTLLQAQGRQYALGAESLAREILRQDREDGDTDCDQDWWAQAWPPFIVEGGAVVGQISDLTGLFNLNNLVDATGQPDPVAVDQFRRLLEAPDIGLDGALADAVVDWMDGDLSPSGFGGAEDDRYTLGTEGARPYRTANRRLTSATELRAVLGFSGDPLEEDAYAILRPYVTALPSAVPTPVNPDTASEALIISLDEGMDPTSASALVRVPDPENPEDCRTQQEIEDQFTQAGVDPAILSGLSTSSDWFGLSVDVSIGTTRVTMYSLLQRDGDQVFARLRTFGPDPWLQKPPSSD